jgi:hypothetical protein
MSTEIIKQTNYSATDKGIKAASLFATTATSRLARVNTVVGMTTSVPTSDHPLPSKGRDEISDDEFMALLLDEEQQYSDLYQKLANL